MKSLLSISIKVCNNRSICDFRVRNRWLKKSSFKALVKVKFISSELKAKFNLCGFFISLPETAIDLNYTHMSDPKCTKLRQ